MSTVFHLIRHAAYELLDQGLGGRLPYPLSPTGQAQAQAIAVTLGPRPIAAIVTSPVQRAIETATPLAAALGLPLQHDPAFGEIDFAAWAGIPFHTLAPDPVWQRWNAFRSLASPPGGETILAVQSRAIAGLSRLAALHPAAEIAVVSHADVIKTILSHLLGAPLDLMRRIEVAAGSISQIILHDHDATIVAINRLP